MKLKAVTDEQERKSYKKMYSELVKNLLGVVFGISLIVLSLMVWLILKFDQDIIPLKPSLFMGIIGIFLAFLGNTLVNDAVTRLGNRSLPQWRWGNFLQALGFSLTVVALLLK